MFAKQLSLLSTFTLSSIIGLILISLFTSTTQAQSKYSVGAIALLGTGSMGNSTDVLSRSMTYTAAELFAGYNIKRFRIGLNYEYNLAGQSADPADFSNQNIGGKGTSLGLRLDFYDGKQSFGLIYKISEKYTLDKPTLAGTVADYDGKSGFNIQYYRQIKNRIGFVVDYANSELKSSNSNSNDIKWDRISLGLVFTNFGKK